MCQCPISGALHFYHCVRTYVDKIAQVSMPYLGRTSFLLETQNQVILISLVSMPYLGRTSFLPNYWLSDVYDEEVSMPYLGRTSFLLRGRHIVHDLQVMCQCPISGALHFYPTPKIA